MKLLVIVGKVWPHPSNNTNLMMKLVPYLNEGADIFILSTQRTEEISESQVALAGYPVEFTDEKTVNAALRGVYQLCALAVDLHGIGDAHASFLLWTSVMRIYRKFSFDAVLVSVEPYSAACVLPLLNRRTKKAVYFMDPTIYQSEELKFRRTMLPRILASADLVLTTPFIRAAMEQADLRVSPERTSTVGFPLESRTSLANTSSIYAIITLRIITSL